MSSPTAGHPAPRLVLASASSARAGVLSRAGIDFEVRVSHVDEDAAIAAQPITPSPSQTATILAATKGRAVLAELTKHRVQQPTVILAADSVFEFQGKPLGKPYTEDVALERWREQAGQAGTLHTGHWVALLQPGATPDDDTCQETTVLDSADVTFAAVDEDTMRSYVTSGEPLGCAGGFTLEGRGAALVESVSGDPNTVLGLSLNVIRKILAGWNISISQFWHPET